MVDPNKNDDTGSGTLASTVAIKLRDRIIQGQLEPGLRLHIQGLSEEFGVNATPVREALNRLVSERLVVQIDQRGFRVAPLNLADLDDLFDARCWANEAALRASIQRGDAAWEERVVLSLHRLSRTPRLTDVQNGLRGEAWEGMHGDFHDTLLSACGSEWMREFCRLTATSAARYRSTARVISAGARDEKKEHQEIADAALSREEDKAARLMVEHFRTTQQIIRARWLAGGTPA